MTELTRDLIAAACQCDGAGDERLADLLRHAADEIDRLQPEVVALKKNLEDERADGDGDRAERDDLQAIIDSLNRLREDEGNAVTFICQNPDFNGQQDEAIEVSAEWTGWEPKRFTGNTLAECLQAAEKARIAC